MRAAGLIIIASAVIATVIGNPARVQAEDRPAQPAAFAQCAACHSTVPGKTAFGPNLFGVGGRRAASIPSYSYSSALKNSGLTWDAATLDRWLTSPQRTVPGTRMPFSGIADRAIRKSVIDYLLTLRQ
jgi:cytochrome c